MTRAAVEAAYRAGGRRVVAALARRFGDLAEAEDALAAALVAALERWPLDGVPDDPVAWLHVTARNRLLDALRRARRTAPGEPGDAPGTPAEDDRLALVLACCHPALAPEARIALTLRHVAGLSTKEIARAFLTTEAAMGRRLSRAQRKVRDGGIRLGVPAPEALTERLDSVLTTVSLVFTEGHAATTGDALVRRELCTEAIELARLLVALAPEAAEPRGLLALLLLTHARRDARTDAGGALVLLADQDRARWDRPMLAAGLALLDGAGDGRFALQARIAGEHARAADATRTDWGRIAALYEALDRVDPSPVARLNGAVALAEARGPAAGLAAAERAGRLGALDAYAPFHVTRGELLTRLGRPEEADAALARAIELTGNAVERAHLVRRRAALGASAPAREGPSVTG